MFPDDEQPAFLTEELEGALKAAGHMLREARRQAARVGGMADSWDLHQLRARLPEARDRVEGAVNALEDLQAALDAFQAPESGPALQAYAEALEETARGLKVNLTGTFPEYTAFPVDLRLEPAQEQAVIGRKRVGTLEPATLIGALQKEQARLQKSAFNAQRFMRILLRAYDLLVPEKGRREVRLQDIYRVLTLRTGPSDYPKMAFAFDIFRLRRESDLILQNRMLEFGHGRTGTFDVPNGRGGFDNLSTLSVIEVATGE